MSERERFEHMIRWYPASWRTRYGEELTTLLHDAHGTAKVPLGVRLSLARRGSIERARASGLFANSLEGPNLTRAGSLLVLWGWALFMVAGAIVAKIGEHWESAVPAAHRSLPRVAFGVVQLAGGLGGLIVLIAAALSLPGFLELLRARKWLEIRRSVIRSMVAGFTAIIATVAIVIWSHHLSPHQRNGGFFFHGLVLVLWSLSIVIALVMATAAATAVAHHTSLSRRVLRLLGSMATALTALMLGVAVGTIIWWAVMADYAPRFLGSGLLATSNVLPPQLIAAVFLMFAGLTLASIGTIRIAQSVALKHPSLD
jgi:hypothetical protein